MGLELRSSVTDCHPQYMQHADQWQRVSDCLGGLEAVRGQTIAVSLDPRALF